MKKTICPECKMEVSIDSSTKSCPNCGCPIEYFSLHEKRGKNKKKTVFSKSIIRIGAYAIGCVLVTAIIITCITYIFKKPTQIGSYSNGYATAILDGKYGYINQDGQEAIPFIFDSVCDFKNGFAKVYKDSLWGMINTQGKEVLLLKYDSIQDFSEHIAIASSEGKFYLFKENGTIIPVITETTDDYNNDFDHGRLKVQRNNKIGIIDIEGSVIAPFDFDDAKLCGASSVIPVMKNGKWGLYDSDKNVNSLVFPYYFDDIELVELSDKYIVKKNGLYGIASLYDFYVIHKKYDIDNINYYHPITAKSIIGDFRGNYFTIRDINGYYIKYFSSHGRNEDVIINLSEYSYVGKPQDSHTVVKKNGKFGIISFNRYGEYSETIPCEYDSLEYTDSSTFLAKKDGFWGAINSILKTIEMPFIYEKIALVGGSSYVVKEDSHWIFLKQIYRYGNIEFESLGNMECDYAEPLNSLYMTNRDGRTENHIGARVKMGNKWNYALLNDKDNTISLLDKHGYEYCSPYSDIMRVVKKGITYYINPKGEKVFPREGNKLIKMSPFSEKYSVAQFEGGKYGYINENGKRVLSLYEDAKPFKDQKAVINNRVYIDKKGTIIGEYKDPNRRPPTKEEIEEFGRFFQFDPDEARRRTLILQENNERNYINKRIRQHTQGMP